jgi:hypothetical protein
MYKAILVRSALKDLHKDALNWLKDKGFEPPVRKTNRRRKRAPGIKKQ